MFPRSEDTFGLAHALRSVLALARLWRHLRLLVQPHIAYGPWKERKQFANCSGWEHTEDYGIPVWLGRQSNLGVAHGWASCFLTLWPKVSHFCPEPVVVQEFNPVKAGKAGTTSEPPTSHGSCRKSNRLQRTESDPLNQPWARMVDQFLVFHYKRSKTNDSSYQPINDQHIPTKATLRPAPW